MKKIKKEDCKEILDKIRVALVLKKDAVLRQHNWGVTLIVGTNLITPMNKAVTTLSPKKNIDETTRYEWEPTD